MAEPARVITERCIDESGVVSTRSYTRHRLLGKGGFARCYELTCNTTGAKFAGKIVEKQTLNKPKARIKFESEIRIHRMLRHSRIVQFMHFFDDDQNYYLLLEICQNQSLSDLMRRRKHLSEHEVRYYIKQLVEGIAYLHSKCVIHRDLKLGNLFLTSDMQLKIGDFGLASLLDSRDEKRKTMCGTPNYIAPEILNGHHNNGHSFEVDIWSTGVVMYTLLVGKPPFETKDVKNTYKLIRAIDYTFPPHMQISASAKSLVMDILQKDPTRRPTIASILAHPFLNEETIPARIPDSAMFTTPPRPSRPRVPLAILAAPSTTTSSSSVLISSQQRSNNKVSSDQALHTSLKASPEVAPKARTVLHSMAKTLSTAFFMVSENTENVSGYESFQAQLELDAKDPIDPANLWVLQFIDYSTRYGLGYLLSNQCSGVYFNDSTKIVSSPTSFSYTERTLDGVEPTSSVYPLTRYPECLTKKVTLLGHFKEYIEGEESEESKTLQRHLLLDLPSIESPMVYISKWHETRHCTMFILSNGTIQANFYDKSKILFACDGKHVTYLDKHDKMHALPLLGVVQSKDQPDLLKRLRYVKDMLQQMVSIAKAA